MFIWLQKLIDMLLLWYIEQSDAGILDLFYENVKIRLNRWYNIIYLYIKRVCLGKKMYLQAECYVINILSSLSLAVSSLF